MYLAFARSEQRFRRTAHRNSPEAPRSWPALRATRSAAAPRTSRHEYLRAVCPPAGCDRALDRRASRFWASSPTGSFRSLRCRCLNGRRSPFSRALPGASAETIASSLTSPLEHQLGLIAGLKEMSSTSISGQSRDHPGIRPRTRIIDDAAGAVQAAINAAGPSLAKEPSAAADLLQGQCQRLSRHRHWPSRRTFTTSRRSLRLRRHGHRSEAVADRRRRQLSSSVAAADPPSAFRSILAQSPIWICHSKQCEPQSARRRPTCPKARFPTARTRSRSSPTTSFIKASEYRGCRRGNEKRRPNQAA